MWRGVLMIVMMSSSTSIGQRWSRITTLNQHHHDDSQGLCRNSSHVVELIKQSKCRPVEQPVPVPVPRGYQSINPSVVFVTRCQGLACHPSSYSCLPLHTTSLKIPVYVHGAGRSRRCLEVNVEVHTGCKCGCDKICPSNQVLQEEECECVCQAGLQDTCEVRQRLWDPSSCTCVCPPAQLSSQSLLSSSSSLV
nr:uncharacterized protein LOC128694291 [Cherax quadricarinatus]